MNILKILSNLIITSILQIILIELITFIQQSTNIMFMRN